MKNPMKYFLNSLAHADLWSLVHYPSMENIEDPDFHQRREAFIDAGKDFMDYVEKKRGEEKADKEA